jgi:hypothetical protein
MLRGPWSASFLTLFQFFGWDYFEHRLARCAEHCHHELGFSVLQVVSVLVMNHVSPWFPERLPGFDYALRLTFQLENHFALNYIPIGRSAVAVRRGSNASWGKRDQDGHCMSICRNRWGWDR